MDVRNGPLVAHPSDEAPIILEATQNGFPISKIEFFTDGKQHFEGMEQLHEDEFRAIRPHLEILSAKVFQEIQRLGTCESWPKNQSFNVTRLIDTKSGLYFTGLVGDPKWFYWNGCLQNWVPTDEPQIEYDKLLNQGEQAFIAHVQQVYPPPISTPVHVGEANDEEIPMETDEVSMQYPVEVLIRATWTSSCVRSVWTMSSVQISGHVGILQHVVNALLG